MTKYIIVGDCLGNNYFLQWKFRFTKHEWNGLESNATRFDSLEDAKATKTKLFKVTKLPLSIKSVK